MDENKPWVILQYVLLNPQDLCRGLETVDKIKKQLKLDVSRQMIYMNDVRVSQWQYLFNVFREETNCLRACTQSIFAIHLTFVQNMFPHTHVVQRHTPDRSPHLETRITIDSAIHFCTLAFFQCFEQETLSYLHDVDVELIFNNDFCDGYISFTIVKKK
jgi:hypothetical protein